MRAFALIRIVSRRGACCVKGHFHLRSAPLPAVGERGKRISRAPTEGAVVCFAGTASLVIAAGCIGPNHSIQPRYLSSQARTAYLQVPVDNRAYRPCALMASQNATICSRSMGRLPPDDSPSTLESLRYRDSLGKGFWRSLSLRGAWAPRSRHRDKSAPE